LSIHQAIEAKRMQMKPFVVSWLGLFWMSASLAAAATTAQAAPPPARLDGFMAELLIVALLIACGAAVVYVLRRKRLTGMGGIAPVQVLSVTALGARERVVMLKVHDRTLLVGVTAAQVSLLVELEKGAGSAGAAAPAVEAAVRDSMARG
jgi:flagellar biogenesis protein FliO